MSRKKPKIVMIGGGTGSFTLLSSLKNYTSNIIAIVNMADDGGSTGVLRDELGALPPGDVRQCLVALSQETEVLRDLFAYRFDAGSLKGHSFGNLFLTALEKTTGSFATAVETAGEVLNIAGEVIPVTLENTRLVLRYDDAEEVSGEAAVDRLRFREKSRPSILLRPAARLNPVAQEAIGAADMVVIAPGTLHTSLLPALVVDGMAQALSQTAAKIVYVCNLVTTAGQTDGYAVHDFVAELERHLGAPLIDWVLYNTEKPPPRLLKRYAQEHEYWVEFDPSVLAQQSYQAVGENFVSKAALEGGLIRHNADKVARTLSGLFIGKKAPVKKS